KMQTHRVTTEADGYGLVIGKGGFKLKEAEPDQQRPAISPRVPEPGVIAIAAHRGSMAQLAEDLYRTMKTHGCDRTGPSGNYSFEFRFIQDTDADLKIDAPSLTTALRESLGLKLEKQKGPVEDLVIDSVEEPTEN